MLGWVTANTSSDAAGTILPASEDDYVMVVWPGNELVEGKRNVPIDLSKAVQHDINEAASVLGSSGSISRIMFFVGGGAKAWGEDEAFEVHTNKVADAQAWGCRLLRLQLVRRHGRLQGEV